MKNIILSTFTLLVIGIFLTINPVIAGDRFKVYETAESGVTIDFKMTLEEIAAEDAENVRLAAIRKIKSEEQKEQTVTYESGESGDLIEFPAKTPDSMK